jgi:hypothetical protein
MLVIMERILAGVGPLGIGGIPVSGRTPPESARL